MTPLFFRCYDEPVRKLAGIIIFILFLLALPQAGANASSDQAYRDYQFQYDLYRQRVNDYRIAYTQYQQYRSLASQQDAIEKVRLLLAQRAHAAKTYFLFLNEKLSENPGLLATDVSFQRTTISNQIRYMDEFAVLAPSVASLEDATRISEPFVNNYEKMQSSYRQIIVTLELGYLNYFAKRFDEIAVHAQSLVAASRAESLPQKQAVLDRWILSLTNKHTLYEQKASAIRLGIPKITGDLQEQDRVFLELQTTIGAARQDIVEAASYLKEIETALMYD